MKYVFHPGCTLNRTHKEIVDKVARCLEVPVHTECCKKGVFTPTDAIIITACPSCENMHRRNSAETVTLWEFLPDDFIYPKYDNLEISIHDPCKVRRGRVYDSVRKLLEKMNIIVKEPLRTREKSPCCEYFGSAENMEKRVSELPLKDAAVYCTGCFAGISKGGGNPIHLIDLLFGGKYGR